MKGLFGPTCLVDGTIWDVLPGSPAYDAGLGPKITVVVVDGNAFSSDLLDESIAHPRSGKITLVVRNFATVETREFTTQEVYSTRPAPTTT